MDHDLTTAPGAAAAADGLRPGGPDTGSAAAGADAGTQAPPRRRGTGARGSGAAGAESGGGRDDSASADGAAGGDRPAGVDDPAGVDGQDGELGPSGPVTTVRLASPGSVIASIPFLFGFHPENSLVVLGVSHSAEGGSFIRHGVRIDLDQVRGHERTTAMELSARMRDQDADIAILVAFGPRAATGAKARPDHCRKLMAAFRAQLEAAADEERVTVVDALYTANGRWWSYMCRNNRCCPSAGTVVPAEAPAALAGAFATRGHTVYASREALEATLDPYPPETLARTAAAAEHIDPAWYDTDAGLADARRLMDVLLARCGPDAEEPTPSTPRPEGPRAGRRGLSDSATAALAPRPGAMDPASAAAASDGSTDAGTGTGTGAGASRSGRPGSASSKTAASHAADGDNASGSDASDRSALGDGSAPTKRAPSQSVNGVSAGASASPSPATVGAIPHSTGAVIPAARASRRVSNRVPAAGRSEGVPLGALAEPPSSLLAPPVISDKEAAELLIALLNWRVRDYLACAAATVDSAGRLLRLGAELARRAPHPELRLAPYALAAWAAWAISRPAVAQCAVDRALAIDPEYKFASLIRAGLHHAIDGEGVRESAASTRRDLFGEAAVDPGGTDSGSTDSGAADIATAASDTTDPDSAPAPIPSPRSTKTVPTESASDLEIS